jgi:hypothetical protein
MGASNDPGSFDTLIRQAEGALAAQLGVPASHAGMIMRIRARTRGISLGSVAREVIAPSVEPDDPNVASWTVGGRERVRLRVDCGFDVTGAHSKADSRPLCPRRRASSLFSLPTEVAMQMGAGLSDALANIHDTTSASGSSESGAWRHEV